MGNPKPWVPPDPNVKGGLDAAREKLQGETSVEFDVQKILTENRIRQEHQKKARKAIAGKLEQELAAARLRGGRKRIHELETELLKRTKEDSHELEVVRHALDKEKARLKLTTSKKTKEQDTALRPNDQPLQS